MNTDLIKHTMGACGEHCCQYHGSPTLIDVSIIVGIIFIVALMSKKINFKNAFNRI